MPKAHFTRPRPVIIPIGPSIAYVELTQNKYSLIDREDADWVGQWNWNASWNHSCKDYRAVRSSGPRNNRVILRLHRELLGASGRETVDHVIPGNGLDNRRANLRIANMSEQNRNRRLHSNNTSGYRGVCLHKKYRKWGAQIVVEKRAIFLGLHDTPEQAYAAYCEAAKKYHGDFATVA